MGVQHHFHGRFGRQCLLNAGGSLCVDERVDPPLPEGSGRVHYWGPVSGPETSTTTPRWEKADGDGPDFTGS